MRSEITTFDFHGDHLDVVHEGDDVWVSVRRLCEALDLAVQPQLHKLRKEPWATLTEIVTVGSDGKQRSMSMLSIKTIPMWLATIKSGKVAQAIRPKLQRYQLECAEVLADHFLGERGATNDGLRRLEAETEHLRWALSSNTAKRDSLLALADLAAGWIDRAVLDSVRVKAYGALADEDVSYLLPPAEPTWVTPTQIAEVLGTTPNDVGRRISRLGIRGKNGVSKAVFNKARTHNKTVTSYLYHPDMIGEIAKVV